MNELKLDDVMRELERMASNAHCNNMRYLEGCGYFCKVLGENVHDMAKGRSPKCNENCEHFAPPYIDEVLRAALALLKKYRSENVEKDAKIERLRAEIEEKEEMLDLIEYVCGQYKEVIDKAGSEAVDEFERVLLLEYSDCTDEEQICVVGLRENIKQIAKEVKGVEDDV